MKESRDAKQESLTPVRPCQNMLVGPVLGDSSEKQGDEENVEEKDEENEEKHSEKNGDRA
mgnify:CR=1 FL=1